MKDKKDKKGYAAACLMSVLIGIQFIFIKYSLESFDDNILMLLFVRFIIAFIAILPFCLKINFKDAFRKEVIILSLIQPCINLLLQTYGVASSDVSAVAYISATGPVITLLLSWAILKNKPKGKQFVAVVLVTAGAFVINIGSGEGGSLWQIGSLLIFLSLVTRSLFAVKIKDIIEDIDIKSICFAQIMWGLIFYFFTFIIFGKEYNLISALTSLDLKAIGSLLYISVISLNLVYFLNNYSLSKITVTVSGILSNITFIVTLLSGIFFLGEEITVWGIVGSVVIIIGVLLLSSSKDKTKTS